MKILGFALAAAAATTCFAEINVTTEHLSSGATAFGFKNVPRPAKGDAAEGAQVKVVDGERDPNGGTAEKLNDAGLPSEEDQPASNFFFRAGGDGGRVLIDLQKSVPIEQINTYSWHGNTRGPQVYSVYANTEASDALKRGTDLESAKWKKIASVNTAAAGGGQHGVSIRDSAGIIGEFRYLLFDISPTEKEDGFGNTFYSEIDVVARGSTVTPIASGAVASAEPIIHTVNFEKGGIAYKIDFDSTVAPDLSAWVERELVPIVKDWYPRIVEMLPSEGFNAPTNVTIRMRDRMTVPAMAGGNTISCNAAWFRNSLKGEARGAVVHELVHIVQQYGRGRRNNPNATRTPGWITEGIPDYIRWFLYEPETKGAEITERNFSRAKYDASYRITGNFLNWVVGKYDKEIIRKLNAAAREARYSDELFKEYTGKTLQELGDEWRAEHEARLKPKAEAAPAAN